MSSIPSSALGTQWPMRRTILITAVPLCAMTVLASMAAAQDTASARLRASPSVVQAGATLPTPRASSAPTASPRRVVDSVHTARSPGALVPAPVVDSAQTDLANPFVQRAISLYEAGNLEPAIAEYRRGLGNDPLDSDTWYGLAELYHEMGRTRQAVDTYTLALATIEHAPELRLPFADLLLEGKRRTEAIKVLQRGIELDPDASADMRALLGNVLVGVLDDTGSRSGVATVAKGTRRAPKPKRKKLCKLFCPGTIQPVVPAAPN
jgi:tetratricopeptide (TPR) repeat protein